MAPVHAQVNRSLPVHVATGSGSLRFGSLLVPGSPPVLVHSGSSLVDPDPIWNLWPKFGLKSSTGGEKSEKLVFSKFLRTFGVLDSNTPRHRKDLDESFW